jgi:hypothetical protein
MEMRYTVREALNALLSRREEICVTLSSPLYLLYASPLTPIASRNLLLYQSLPACTPLSTGQCEEAKRCHRRGHNGKKNWEVFQTC